MLWAASSLKCLICDAIHGSTVLACLLVGWLATFVLFLPALAVSHTIIPWLSPIAIVFSTGTAALQMLLTNVPILK